jgi:hypothetical protein
MQFYRDLANIILTFGTGLIIESNFDKKKGNFHGNFFYFPYPVIRKVIILLVPTLSRITA